MGCSSSSSEILERVPKSWWVLFHKMKFTKHEIAQLYNLFCKADVDLSGTVDMVELLTLLDIERTSFSVRVFGIFDKDKSGLIDFKEFVLAAWNYCTLSDSSLEVFTFDLFDADGSGKLNGQEVHKMMKDIYGKSLESNTRIKAIEKALEKYESRREIDIEYFVRFGKEHPALLFPAFNLQQELQQKILGASFWKRCSRRRVEISQGKYITVEALMEKHLSKEELELLLLESQRAKVNSPKVSSTNQDQPPHRNKHHSAKVVVT